MCKIERREIVIEKINGKHRRAMTLEEALELREKRRARRLQREAEEAAEKAARQAAKAAAKADRQREQDDDDDVVVYVSGTLQSGGIDPEQRISRCSFGRGPEWCRKDKYDRADGCGCGDKGLRAKTRARRRHDTHEPVWAN